tara:strand:+ start:91 stop:372 length:282 start_codon:yes stop_codon:yes gene_type:complete
MVEEKVEMMMAQMMVQLEDQEEVTGIQDTQELLPINLLILVMVLQHFLQQVSDSLVEHQVEFIHMVQEAVEQVELGTILTTQVIKQKVAQVKI